MPDFPIKPVLVATADEKIFQSIQDCLQEHGSIYYAPDWNRCLEIFSGKRFEFTFIDIELLPVRDSKLTPKSIKDALNSFWAIYPSAEIVMLVSQDRVKDAVNAVKAGAGSYIIHPVNPEELLHITEKIFENRRRELELGYLRDQFRDQDFFDVVRTRSPEMKKVLDKIRSVAPTRTTVILYGETGTGKGVMADLIHAQSNRKKKPFISVHCGAIPDTLIESELFGHEKGAFTGAVKRTLGKFEIARGGTIFLDEIGTITPAAQVKLLEVLQERRFNRLGGEINIDIDARIIAATNNDLHKMVEEQRFRKDLYYRLNVFPLDIPPLRSRLEDLPVLSEIFLKRLNRYYDKEITGIHPSVMAAFKQYDWPGNIRELENLIERAYILESEKTLMPDAFPLELLSGKGNLPPYTLGTLETLAETRRRGTEEIERKYLIELLSRYKGRIQPSAEHAGISTRQLHKLLTKYDIHKKHFK